jgi:hypothetical protein
VHFSGRPGLSIGREALIASLLLAHCGYLVKTPVIPVGVVEDL